MAINKVGKIGRINTNANKILKELFEYNEIYRCELCQSIFFLHPHHRHKRLWYRGKPELLSTYNQAVLLCAKCHDEAERNKEYSKKIFLRLRGEEIDNDKKSE